MHFFSHSRKCLLNLLSTYQSKTLYQKYLIIFDYLFSYFNNFSMLEEQARVFCIWVQISSGHILNINQKYCLTKKIILLEQRVKYL